MGSIAICGILSERYSYGVNSKLLRRIGNLLPNAIHIAIDFCERTDRMPDTKLTEKEQGNQESMEMAEISAIEFERRSIEGVGADIDVNDSDVTVSHMRGKQRAARRGGSEMR